MKAHTMNAIAFLLERAEVLEMEGHDNWRCIYVQLNDKRERFNETLRTNFIIRPIIDLLSRDEGFIYFCDDGDVFILFEGALKPVIAKLSSHFGDLDPDQLRGQTGDNLFSFFDLSKHWEGFSDLCRVKSTRTLPAGERLPRVQLSSPSQGTQRASA